MLYLRVRPTGRKTFELRLSHGGKTRWRTLGHFPQMSLNEALALVHTRKSGRGPTGVPATDTCAQALQNYFDLYIERRYKRTANVRVYMTYLQQELASTPLRMLTRRMLTRAIEDYARRPTAKAGRTKGAVAQNRLLGFAKAWLRWCVGRGDLDTNPADGLTRDIAGGPEQARERVLSVEELRAMWHREGAHTPLLRALLLTGCRIRELQLARWKHTGTDPVRRFDMQAVVPDGTRPPTTLTIPKEHAKNKREHLVPLAQLVLVQTTPGKEHEPLFPRSACTSTAVEGWVSEWQKRQGIVDRWTPHDLRRTFASLLQELGVPVDTVQRALNHKMQGTVSRYARHDYYPERREALHKLAVWVRKHVAGLDLPALPTPALTTKSYKEAAEHA